MAAVDVGRLQRAVRRYGIRGTAVRAAELVKHTLAGFEQEHVWYQLPLRAARPRRELDPAFRLVRAGEDDIPRMVWEIDPGEAARRLRSGGTLWLVLEGEEPAFSCWTFRGRTPIRAAQGGWLELPDNTACLEESMTSEAYRGRSVAPGAWTLIADELAGDPGLMRLVTAVEEENAASRAAVAKVGFAEIGRARTAKRGRRLSVRVTSPALDGDGAFLRPLERQR
jgi:RimJ/RimL family protein N-acetyltransferase